MSPSLYSSTFDGVFPVPSSRRVEVRVLGKSRDGPYSWWRICFLRRGKMGETLVFHRRSASNHQFLSLGWLQSYEFLFFFD